MAWDFGINPQTNDMTGKLVTGQDEIVQRMRTRVYRLYREWFANKECGIPWYDGPSNINPSELTRQTGILGTRNFRYANNWIRNEIAETDGIIRMFDFNTAFDATTRNYAIRTEIATMYGLPFIVALDTTMLLRGGIPEEL